MIFFANRKTKESDILPVLNNIKVGILRSLLDSGETLDMNLTSRCMSG